MGRFKFILEPLLKVRRLEEERCHRTLAHLHHSREAIEETLRRHQRNLAEGKDDIRRAATGHVDLDTMRGHAAASIAVMRRANQAVLQLAGIHQQIDRARADLIERSRARRAIELLREKRRAEWTAEQERVEGAALDELAVIAAYAKEMSS